MIRVHWNLHRGGHSVSVYNPTVKGWRVVSNPDAVCLRNVRFVVSDKGLARMRGLGKRKVVAWAEGDAHACDCTPAPDAVSVRFNPWRADRFHVAGEPHRTVDAADHVHFETLTADDGTRVPLTRVLA